LCLSQSDTSQISSLSLENQPSSLPPDLTALVLILFDVGGVDSMIEEKRDKGSHTRRERDVARDWLNWLFL